MQNGVNVQGFKMHVAGQRLALTPAFTARRSSPLPAAATAAPAAPATASGPIDENAVLDVVIVGAGISGLTTALVSIAPALAFPFIRTGICPSI
jgi:hypothetical protein